MAFGEIGKLFVSIGADLKDFQTGLKTVDKDMQGISGTLVKHSKTFKVAGVAMAGAAAGVGIAGLKMAANFEGAMREVNTMMGLSQEEFETLSDQVLQSATDIGKAPAEMAKALYQVVSAGIPAGEAIQFLETSARAAVGGVTEIETAVDGLTTVINAFGMDASEADRVADIMFTTVKGGKTTFEELSASLFNVAPIAAASGVEFKEVAAALATMTKQGVPTKIATTQLRQAMVVLQKPTAEMQEVLKGLGYESGQAMLEELGLAQGLNVLRNSTAGSNEMLMKMFGSVEAGSAVLALTGSNADTFTADLEAMTMASDGAGAATEAFTEMNRGASRQFEVMMVQVKGIAIQIGTALMPAILAIAKAITPLLTMLADWIAKNPMLTAGLIVATGVIGGLLLVLGFLAPVMGGISAAASAMGIAITFALGPIGLIIIAVAALIGVSVYLITQWHNLSTVVKALGIAFLVAMGPMGQMIAMGIAIWRNWDKIAGAITAAWDGVVFAVKTSINAVIWLFNKMLGFFSDRVLFEFKVPSWVPGIGGKGFTLQLPTIPEIPSLQFGGVVPGPRGAPTLAIVHGGEEYLGMGGRGAGRESIGELHIHTVAFMGTRADAKRLWDFIREESRRDQRTVFGSAEF